MPPPLRLTLERRFLAAQLLISSYGPARWHTWEAGGVTYIGVFTSLQSIVTPWPVVRLSGLPVGYLPRRW